MPAKTCRPVASMVSCAVAKSSGTIWTICPSSMAMSPRVTEFSRTRVPLRMMRLKDIARSTPALCRVRPGGDEEGNVVIAAGVGDAEADGDDIEEARVGLGDRE